MIQSVLPLNVGMSLDLVSSFRELWMSPKVSIGGHLSLVILR